MPTLVWKKLLVSEAELTSHNFVERLASLRLLKRSKDLIQGDLFSRGVREIEGEIYTINVYKERNAPSLRFEVYRDYSGRKMVSCVHSLGEVCELIDVWEIADVASHKDKILSV
jgi:hypothetical protein